MKIIQQKFSKVNFTSYSSNKENIFKQWLFGFGLFPCGMTDHCLIQTVNKKVMNFFPIINDNVAKNFLYWKWAKNE